MFLFITTSDNFSPSHKAPRDHGNAEKTAGTPSEVTCTPTAGGRRRGPPDSPVTSCFSCFGCDRQPRPSMRLAVRVCDGPTITTPTHRRPCQPYRKLGNVDTGHRLPAWLRPGTKWPPGKKWLPLPHLVLGRLEKATSFPATVSTLWFRQHGPACQRGARSDPRPRRPCRRRPAAQPRSARLSACGWAYPPGSRADFTPRIFGPLSGAFDYARPVSIR